MKNRNKLTTGHAKLAEKLQCEAKTPQDCRLPVSLLSATPILSIDSLRSPYGLPEEVFLRSALILSKNSPIPPNPISHKNN